MKKIFFLFSVCAVVLSCQEKYPSDVQESFELAGSNRNELENVISHYEENKNDSLKLKAALFLIKNMKFHTYEEKFTHADNIFNKIETLKTEGNDVFEDRKRKNYIEKQLDSLNNIYSDVLTSQNPKATDVTKINAEFLINNIDLAFEAWGKIPLTYRANFNDFCNYVLPYRNGSEPVSINDRKLLMNKYSWISDSLRLGTSIQRVVDIVREQIHFRTLMTIREKYPQPLSVLDFDKIKVGLCADGTTYMVHLFRALGIATGNDYVPHWGNHWSRGHDWFFVKYGRETLYLDAAVEPNDPKDLLLVYKVESIPKIYRKSFAVNGDTTFSIRDLDVTSEYFEVLSPKIPIVLNHSLKIHPKICVYDVEKGWAPVDEALFKDSYIQTHNLGLNVVYMAGYFNDNQFMPINYPFTFDKYTKELHFFKPSSTIINSAIVERKYPLFSKRYQLKRILIEELNGCFFEGSNDSIFQKRTILYTIHGLDSPQLQRVKIVNSTKYKHLRFYSPKLQGYVSELAFYDKQGHLLTGQVLKSNPIFKDSLNDNNTNTYFGGEKEFIGVQLKIPSSIGSIEFQSRNDGNHIIVGNTYELFYWNKDWVLVETKLAKGPILPFDKLPKNALFLLKNKTKKGKEHHVFVLDENKRQRWIGSHVR
jgi:hypothetical protein